MRSAAGKLVANALVGTYGTVGDGIIDVVKVVVTMWIGAPFPQITERIEIFMQRDIGPVVINTGVRGTTVLRTRFAQLHDQWTVIRRSLLWLQGLIPFPFGNSRPAAALCADQRAWRYLCLAPGFEGAILPCDVGWWFLGGWGCLGLAITRCGLGISCWLLQVLLRPAAVLP